MKFITAFLTMLTAGIKSGAVNPTSFRPKKSRSRIPGSRNPPGTKLSRLAREQMITKRGRRPGGAGG